MSAFESLAQALRNPACYPHPVGRVELIETHISCVLLAGEFAYKLKKPVRLPFLDFSTSEARRRFCEEEVRVNRRTAASLYLGVVPIAGEPSHPRVGAAGPVLEHAVWMRRFPQEALLSELARHGRLQAGHVDALARSVAALHAGAERGSRGGSPASAALANFFEITQLGVGRSVQERLAPLRRWTLAEARALEERFAQRAAGGFERECHGDLHLANVAMVGGRPTPFDAIEFSEPLRWIDVASDVAFTAMDLQRHGLDRLAARFVDRYLEQTGDYGALTVLRFYMVYRAMVRAKVAAIAAGQAPAGTAAARARTAGLVEYLEFAARLARRGPALLVAMHGLPASGKTTVSGLLVEALGGVRVRSDVERKRLHGLDPHARADAPPGEGLYGAQATAATYDRLAEAARAILASGRPAIVDATFATRAQRERFRALAGELGAAFQLVSCTAPEAVLRARIAERSRLATDASDAGLAVLEHRLAATEPPAVGEQAAEVDTAAPGLDQAVEALASRLRGGAL